MKAMMSVLGEQLKHGECLIKVAYSAVNRADLLQRKGVYPPPPGESNVLGLEAAGLIAKADAGGRWNVGDRVMALLGSGGYAQYAKVNAGHVMRVPSNLSLREASAIPEVWLTAFQLIYFVSDLKTRETDPSKLSYLVHAGASGVGTALIQLLSKVVGSEKVFVTVGSDEKKNYINQNLNINLNHLINYKTEDFQARIHEVTSNAGVDFVFDCVGASYWQKNIDSLALDGNWVLYGTLSGGNVTGDILSRIQRKRIQLRSTTLRNRSAQYKERLVSEFEGKILKHFENGTLKPIIDTEFPLEQVDKAHERVESNANIGKVLLKVFGEMKTINEEL